jgi:AcrR family transcriptional regulator
MSHIAHEAGIGRATLYKYFPDVEAILHAQHERHIRHHLDRLNELRQGPGDTHARLEAVCLGYAQICRHRAQHGTMEMSALLRKPEHVGEAESQLLELFADLLSAAAAAGHIDTATSVEELAAYCMHALGAAAALRSDAAVRRLVDITLAALGSRGTGPDGCD